MNNIQVGDLVTSYWKGYFEVTAVKRRWAQIKASATQGQKYAYATFVYDAATCGEELNPIIHLSQRYRSDGTPVKVSKTTRSCDSAFCKPAKEEIRRYIAELEQVIKNLNQI